MSRRAFSLAEVMVAVGLVGMAILGLVSAQIFATRARHDVSRRQTAGVIATSMMNDAQASLAYDFSASVARPRAVQPTYPEFQTEVDEQKVMPGQLDRVEVVVYWTGKYGPQEYRLWTEFAPAR